MEIKGVKPLLQANTEGLLIWEMDHHMDIDMFLNEYPHWEVEGLHHPLILQEMFLQAAHSRREAEWMISWGCQHGLLHLDLQVDISAIQSVGPQTSRKEIWHLYYQVYKQRRLPGSPPWGLEWADKLVRDIVSSLKNCLMWKEDELPRVAQAAHLMRNRTPWGERGITSTETQLPKAREAHRRDLATTIPLEEKIEQLSWSITRDCQDAHAPSQSWDWWRRRSQGWSRRCHKALPESTPGHSPAHSPPQWEDVEVEFDLGPPLELGPDVEQFFQGPAGKCEADPGSHSPTEPPAEEY